MYFWKIDSLKEHLIRQGLTQDQAFYYLMIQVVLALVGIEISKYFPHQSTGVWDYFFSYLAVSISIVGTIFLFRTNGGSSGKHFLERYISIGFVVAVRSTVFLGILLLVSIPVGALVSMVTEFAEDQISYVIDEVIFAFWEVVLFVLTGRHIRAVAQTAI